MRKTVRGGTGSGEVNVRHFVNIEEGLTNAGFTLTTKEWLDGYDAVWAQAREGFVNGIREEAKKLGVPAMMLGMGRTMREPDYSLPLDAEGDIAIYVLARNSGEGSDRKPEAGDINLTETEIRDILTLNEKYDKFVLVLNVGGMIDLEPVKEVKNILLLGQLGTPTGDVLADLLLGKAYPSGKMTMTSTGIQKYPSTEGFADPDDTCYKEGVYVGYRYFETVGEKTEYPFGYGLGYTTFATKCKRNFHRWRNYFCENSCKKCRRSSGKRSGTDLCGCTGRKTGQTGKRAESICEDQRAGTRRRAGSNRPNLQQLPWPLMIQSALHGFWKKEIIRSCMETAQREPNLPALWSWMQMP